MVPLLLDASARICSDFAQNQTHHYSLLIIVILKTVHH